MSLWDVIVNDANPASLSQNPTLAQIRKHEEDMARKPKALTCIHLVVLDAIFIRIMTCDLPKQAWDKLKEEFESSDRVKSIKMLTLKREFKMLRMKDGDTVKEYSSKLMQLVNQIRLYELISKLQAQEQRTSMRSEENIEGAFIMSTKTRKMEGKMGRNLLVEHAEQQAAEQANHTQDQLQPEEQLFMVRKPSQPLGANVWLVDSGCTSHMTGDVSMFTSLDKSYKVKVKLGNGDLV
ncbi:uncharacterized protein LOC127794637 [Diospyros lotus]|uniref:uncharacterized protein LOC127794637 n=1 Tax=Diospyros lotus TaxID=55363 RepID=UPI00225A43C1|nr:uncharacterized protein LOC127794637 [Diospyros lotus]